MHFKNVFVFVGVAANQKIPEHIVIDVYLYATLFRIPARETAAEKEFDIAIQMTIKQILVQRFKSNRNGRKK